MPDISIMITAPSYAHQSRSDITSGETGQLLPGHDSTVLMFVYGAFSLGTDSCMQGSGMVGKVRGWGSG